MNIEELFLVSEWLSMTKYTIKKVVTKSFI